MTVISIQYLFIKYVEFAFLFYSGYRLSKTKQRRDYWINAIIPILIFAIVEGLRWDRGVDYKYYYFLYNSFSSWIDQDYNNPLFTSVCYSLKIMGFPFEIFLVLQCGFLMFSFIFFVEPYKKYALFILPLVLLVTLSNENFIRWWFAYGFILIGFSLLLKKHIILFVIFITCSFFTHWGIVAVVPILFLVPFLNHVRISPHILTLILLLFLFVGTVTEMTFLVNIADFVLQNQMDIGNETMHNYLNATNNLIEGDFGEMGITQLDYSSRIKHIITYVPIFYYAPQYMKRIPYGIGLYNIVAIAAIFAPIFGQVELLGRYTQVLLSFFCVVSGCTMCQVFFNEYSNTKKTILIISFVVSIYAIINGPFVRPDDFMYFIWD